jgi:hypothetical protein
MARAALQLRDQATIAKLEAALTRVREEREDLAEVSVHEGPRVRAVRHSLAARCSKWRDLRRSSATPCSAPPPKTVA